MLPGDLIYLSAADMIPADIRLIAARDLFVSQGSLTEVLEFAYLNSFYQTGFKKLLDVAALEYIELHESLRVEKTFRKIDEIPFDFAHRRMSELAFIAHVVGDPDDADTIYENLVCQEIWL